MDNCLFCKMVKGEIPYKKVYEDSNVLAILDLHPSSNGHTLVIPKKHVTDMFELDDDALTHIYEVAKKLSPTLMEKFNATALSLRVNYGDTQEIKHFHLHILPDYGIKKPTISQNDAYEIIKDSFN